jgi:hypothetical protein
MLDRASDEAGPAAGTAWPAGRTIPAASLREVLSDTNLRADPRGLWIRGARFDEPIDLAYFDFPHPIGLVDCLVQAGLNATRARFLELSLKNAIVEGGFHADGVTISGQLNLNGATLRNPAGDALILDNADIGGAL